MKKKNRNIPFRCASVLNEPVNTDLIIQFTAMPAPSESGEVLPVIVPVDGSNVAQTGTSFNTHELLNGGANVGEVSYQFPCGQMDMVDAMSKSAESMLNAREYLEQHQDDNSFMNSPEDINF